MKAIRAALDRLGQRTLPHHGQLVLWALLGAAVFLTGHTTPWARGEPTGATVTILSSLPRAWLESPALHTALRGAVWAGALLWLAQVLIPWSAWVTVLAFTALVAQYEENLTYVDHMFHVTNMLLIVHALWYHLCATDIRAALRRGTFWTEPLYPRWVRAAGLLSIGVFYSLVGVNKLLESGLDWVNGTSLQLWALAFGRPSAARDLLLAHRPLAVALQAVTLAAETLALVAVAWPWPRALIGALLVGFHLGQHVLFGWAFHGNTLLLVLLLFPVAEALDRLVPRLRAGAPRPPGPRGRLQRALLGRVDPFGRWSFPRERGALDVS